jgi:putative two-component system response regulator
MTAQQETILIVDDEEAIRKLLRQKLTMDGYRCQTAASASLALDVLRGSSIDLVLLDIRMPGKLGTEFLPEIKAEFPDTAVIMSSAVSDSHIAIQCMREGAYDYIIKPFNLDRVTQSVAWALKKRGLQIAKREYQQHLEQEVAVRTTELKHALEKIETASLDTIYRLSRAAEYKDENTGSHIRRIGEYSAVIARKMGLDDIDVDMIFYAAPMHDVGKIGIPDSILLKPGKLEPEEWEIMKRHTTIGAQILAGSEAEFIGLAEVIALTHHEKWDGSGYPNGLRKSEIPLAGRIVAIADVFDALTSQRPYKEPFPVEECFNIIRQSRGSHFDPEVADAFFASQGEILSIKERLKDTST